MAGWSDGVEEKLKQLQDQVNWLAARYAEALVGRRVRLPDDWRWAYSHGRTAKVLRGSYEGVVHSVDESGGTVGVRSDAGEDLEESIFDLEVVK